MKTHTVTILIQFFLFGHEVRTSENRVVLSNLTSFKQLDNSRITDNVTVLEIRNSKLAAIPNATFSKFSKIEEFCLSDLEIGEVQAGAFSQAVKRLYLDHNQLGRLESGFLSPLTSLQILNVSYNQIWEIEPNFLDPDATTDLTSIDLSHNKLTRIENVLPYLMNDLNVSHNRIKEVDFVNATDLTYKFYTIDLSHNEIETVLHFANLDSVVINLNHNNLTKLGKVSDSVNDLYLTHNKFEKLEAKAGTSSPFLSLLDLGYNSISSIHRNYFRYYDELKVLNLTHNQLGNVDAETFRTLHKLTHLDLSWNRIQVIHLGDNLHDLEFLDISYNRLATLNLRMCLKNLKFVSLMGNPWKCESLKKVFGWLSDVTVPKEGVHVVGDIQGIACHSE